jgi:hypothetical protein
MGLLSLFRGFNANQARQGKKNLPARLAAQHARNGKQNKRQPPERVGRSR